jgi:hypothetical protein
MAAQQPKIQQFESTGFQDPQTAETSGSYDYNSDGKLEGEKGLEKKMRKKNRTAAETLGSYDYSSDGKPEGKRGK